MFVGIDPGFKGAIALLSQDGTLTVHDMPVWKGASGQTLINLFELGTLLVPTEPGPNITALEKVGPRSKEGVSSAFRFGQGFGALQMALTGHGYTTTEVTPTRWKRYFGLSSDKDVSRAMAASRFPAYAGLFSRVKDDGRAEAALLALYAKEKLA